MSDSGVFKAAVKLSPDRRAAYLDQACGANLELRREVAESYLRVGAAQGLSFESNLGKTAEAQASFQRSLAIDPNQPLFEVKTMELLLAEQMSGVRGAAFSMGTT